ncbi:hypothetical protein DICA3_C17106 [Diutina catenulata]
MSDRRRFAYGGQRDNIIIRFREIARKVAHLCDHDPEARADCLDAAYGWIEVWAELVYDYEVWKTYLEGVSGAEPAATASYRRHLATIESCIDRVETRLPRELIHQYDPSLPVLWRNMLVNAREGGHLYGVRWTTLGEDERRIWRSANAKAHMRSGDWTQSGDAVAHLFQREFSPAVAPVEASDDDDDDYFDTQGDTTGPVPAAEATAAEALAPLVPDESPFASIPLVDLSGEISDSSVEVSAFSVPVDSPPPSGRKRRAGAVYSGNAGDSQPVQLARRRRQANETNETNETSGASRVSGESRSNNHSNQSGSSDKSIGSNQSGGATTSELKAHGATSVSQATGQSGSLNQKPSQPSQQSQQSQQSQLSQSSQISPINSHPGQPSVDRSSHVELSHVEKPSLLPLYVASDSDDLEELGPSDSIVISDDPGSESDPISDDSVLSPVVPPVVPPVIERLDSDDEPDLSVSVPPTMEVPLSPQLASKSGKVSTKQTKSSIQSSTQPFAPTQPHTSIPSQLPPRQPQSVPLQQAFAGPFHFPCEDFVNEVFENKTQFCPDVLAEDSGRLTFAEIYTRSLGRCCSKYPELRKAALEDRKSVSGFARLAFVANLGVAVPPHLAYKRVRVSPTLEVTVDQLLRDSVGSLGDMGTARSAALALAATRPFRLAFDLVKFLGLVTTAGDEIEHFPRSIAYCVGSEGFSGLRAVQFLWLVASYLEPSAHHPKRANAFGQQMPLTCFGDTRSVIRIEVRVGMFCRAMAAKNAGGRLEESSGPVSEASKASDGSASTAPLVYLAHQDVGTVEMDEDAAVEAETGFAPAVNGVVAVRERTETRRDERTEAQQRGKSTQRRVESRSEERRDQSRTEDQRDQSRNQTQSRNKPKTRTKRPSTPRTRTRASETDPSYVPPDPHDPPSPTESSMATAPPYIGKPRSTTYPMWRRNVHHDVLVELFSNPVRAFRSPANFPGPPRPMSFAELYVASMFLTPHCPAAIHTYVRPPQAAYLPNVAKLVFLANARQLPSNWVWPHKKTGVPFHVVPSLYLGLSEEGAPPLPSAREMGKFLQNRRVPTSKAAFAELPHAGARVVDAVRFLSTPEAEDWHLQFMEFFDARRVAPAFRVQRFLWVMWNVLESASGGSDASNPFGGANKPPFRLMTENEVRKANTDSDAEEAYWRRMREWRKKQHEVAELNDSEVAELNDSEVAELGDNEVQELNDGQQLAPVRAKPRRRVRSVSVVSLSDTPQEDTSVSEASYAESSASAESSRRLSWVEGELVELPPELQRQAEAEEQAKQREQSEQAEKQTEEQGEQQIEQQTQRQTQQQTELLAEQEVEQRVEQSPEQQPELSSGQPGQQTVPEWSAPHGKQPESLHPRQSQPLPAQFPPHTQPPVRQPAPSRLPALATLHEPVRASSAAPISAILAEPTQFARASSVPISAVINPVEETVEVETVEVETVEAVEAVGPVEPVSSVFEAISLARDTTPNGSYRAASVFEPSRSPEHSTKPAAISLLLNPTSADEHEGGSPDANEKPQPLETGETATEVREPDFVESDYIETVVTTEVELSTANGVVEREQTPHPSASDASENPLFVPVSPESPSGKRARGSYEGDVDMEDGGYEAGETEANPIEAESRPEAIGSNPEAPQEDHTSQKVESPPALRSPTQPTPPLPLRSPTPRTPTPESDLEIVSISVKPSTSRVPVRPVSPRRIQRAHQERQPRAASPRRIVRVKSPSQSAPPLPQAPQSQTAQAPQAQTPQKPAIGSRYGIDDELTAESSSGSDTEAPTLFYRLREAAKRLMPGMQASPEAEASAVGVDDLQRVVDYGRQQGVPVKQKKPGRGGDTRRKSSIGSSERGGSIGSTERANRGSSIGPSSELGPNREGSVGSSERGSKRGSSRGSEPGSNRSSEPGLPGSTRGSKPGSNRGPPGLPGTALPGSDSPTPTKPWLWAYWDDACTRALYAHFSGDVAASTARIAAEIARLTHAAIPEPAVRYLLYHYGLQDVGVSQATLLSAFDAAYNSFSHIGAGKMRTSFIRRSIKAKIFVDLAPEVVEAGSGMREMCMRRYGRPQDPQREMTR